MLAVVQPNWHFHTGLEKTGEGKEPHPHNSQRGHSITAVGRITGFLQVHETSSVHCESEIILFIQQQWNLNKNNCTHTHTHTHTHAHGGHWERYQIVTMYFSRNWGGGGDLFHII